MKVFFNFSGRSSEESRDSLEKMYRYLIELGHKHTFQPGDLGSKDNFYHSDKDRREVVSSAIKAIHSSQMVVLEVSTPSVTQGFFIGKALEELKPVICLHRKNTNPLFLHSFNNPLLQTVEYDEWNLKEVLHASIAFAQESLPTRYNIILSPDITNYLRWITRTYNRSRSEFIRDLIRQHMLQTGFSSTPNTLEANLTSPPATITVQ